MFNFEITPLSNLFFGMTFIVFSSLFFVKNENRSLFLHTLLLASLGVLFYAKDFITLFIGWEVMSWSSYFLIARNAKLKTMQKYIIFNIAGAFSMLGAIAIIYSLSGTFIYSEIDLSNITYSNTLLISTLFLITIFIKSGIVPFHYWIVDSYSESETLFTTILSAIISKVGIFLFIIIFIKIFKIDGLLFDIVAWLGVTTSIIATFKAINEDEMKRLLAYSSIAQVSYIITIITILSNSAIEAGLYHSLIHTFVKLLLFINIASIIYVTGKTKFSELGNLLYEYPTLFILLVIGIITLAGMPPLGGFNSKFIIYTTLLQEKKPLLLAMVMFSSASAFLYCYKLVYGIYLGQKVFKIEYKKVPFNFYIPQFIGALIVIILGIFPSSIVPYFNKILSSLNLPEVVFNNTFELTTSFASFNGGVVMLSFGVIFIIVLTIFVNLRSKAIKAKDRYDISYCGEVPTDRANLHYGFGMGQELKRVSFIKVILKNSSSAIWNRVEIFIFGLSMVIKRIHNFSTENVVALILLIFTISLIVGVK